MEYTVFIDIEPDLGGHKRGDEATGQEDKEGSTFAMPFSAYYKMGRVKSLLQKVQVLSACLVCLYLGDRSADSTKYIIKTKTDTIKQKAAATDVQFFFACRAKAHCQIQRVSLATSKLSGPISSVTVIKLVLLGFAIKKDVMSD